MLTSLGKAFGVLRPKTGCFFCVDNNLGEDSDM